jgi:hypothetical protein
MTISRTLKIQEYDSGGHVRNKIEQNIFFLCKEESSHKK